MTEEERKIFQSILDNMYERFLSVIAENRKDLTLEKLKPLADGRIYTARQAWDYGLIDQIGYLDEPITLAKQEAGLTTARVVIYHRPGALQEQHMGSQLSNSSFSTINLLNIELKTFVRSGTPSFMYLWAP